MELTKKFTFEASHILPKHPGRCSRLHGHSWVLYVSVAGKINKETGFVMDFADISAVVKPLIEELDHKHLGAWGLEFDRYLEFYQNWAVPFLPRTFYPSSENLLWCIGDSLRNRGLDWSKLALDETCTSHAELTRNEFDAAYA